MDTTPKRIGVTMFGAAVTAVIVWRVRGWEAFKKHVIEDILIVFGGAVCTWLLIFLFTYLRLPYKMLKESDANLTQVIEDKLKLSEKVNELNSQLAQTPKAQGKQMMTAPAKGGLLDRVLNSEQSDRLYLALKKIANTPQYKNSVTITIAPYAMQDRESFILSEQLEKIFEDAHWNVYRQTQLPVTLVGRAQHIVPIGVYLFTTEDSSFEYYVWSALYESGINAVESPTSDLPVGFKGTILWVGYKDRPF